MHTSEEWFKYWFDSHYYYILYQNRDNSEAHHFMDNLVRMFGMTPEHTVLDAGCGKGRHAVYLNKKGLAVTGFDIAPQSIRSARQYSNERLHFYIHDMRETFVTDTYDFVLNLFTSFGYFGHNEENQHAVNTMANALKPGGKLLVDFMNTPRVLNELITSETKYINGIAFKISRYLEDDFLVKRIDFEDDGMKKDYIEKVKMLYKEDFCNYFQNAGLRYLNCYGNYDFHNYEEETSERMILVAEKI